MIGTSVTRPDTLAFVTKLATLPKISTNGLKASAGVADLIQIRDWADSAFLSGDDIVRATGLAMETVTKTVSELLIVEKVAAGRRWTAYQPGYASEWILNLNFPKSYAPWPTHALSPAHPQWDRGSALGPNAWRLALALFDQLEFERGSFGNNDLRGWTGMDPKTASRTLAKAEGKFISKHPSRRHVYTFEPDQLSESDTPVTRPLSNREVGRANERNRLKALQGDDAGNIATPTVRPLREGEDRESYQRTRAALEALINAVTDKENARLQDRIRTEQATTEICTRADNVGLSRELRGKERDEPCNNS